MPAAGGAECVPESLPQGPRNWVIGVGAERCTGQEPSPSAPSSLPPSELPLPVGRRGNDGGRRFCRLPKTPSPQNGKDSQLDLSNLPGDPPWTSPQLPP